MALSVGLRPPGVTWHPVLWSPDFPRRPGQHPGQRDCLSGSPRYPVWGLSPPGCKASAARYTWFRGAPLTATAAPGTNGLGLLNQGYVETSNVNVVEELVSMIQTQRGYEINSKSISTSDQMLQRLAQL